MDPARLRSLPLFRYLSAQQVEQVARWTEELDVPAGLSLVEQGASPHEFFIIEEGTAEVLADGRHVADLGPGDFFGEMALMERERRAASVIATSDVRLILMRGRDFREMAEAMPEVADTLRSALKQRAAELG